MSHNRKTSIPRRIDTTAEGLAMTTQKTATVGEDWWNTPLDIPLGVQSMPAQGSIPEQLVAYPSASQQLQGHAPVEMKLDTCPGLVDFSQSHLYSLENPHVSFPETNISFSEAPLQLQSADFPANVHTPDADMGRPSQAPPDSADLTADHFTQEVLAFLYTAQSELGPVQQTQLPLSTSDSPVSCDFDDAEIMDAKSHATRKDCARSTNLPPPSSKLLEMSRHLAPKTSMSSRYEVPGNGDANVERPADHVVGGQTWNQTMAHLQSEVPILLDEEWPNWSTATIPAANGIDFGKYRPPLQRHKNGPKPDSNSNSFKKQARKLPLATKDAGVSKHNKTTSGKARKPRGSRCRSTQRASLLLSESGLETSREPSLLQSVAPWYTTPQAQPPAQSMQEPAIASPAESQHCHACTRGADPVAVTSCMNNCAHTIMHSPPSPSCLGTSSHFSRNWLMSSSNLLPGTSDTHAERSSNRLLGVPAWDQNMATLQSEFPLMPQAVFPTLSTPTTSAINGNDLGKYQTSSQWLATGPEPHGISKLDSKHAGKPPLKTKDERISKHQKTTSAKARKPRASKGRPTKITSLLRFENEPASSYQPSLSLDVAPRYTTLQAQPPPLHKQNPALASPAASKHCHVCTRGADRVAVAYCMNIMNGTCRKIICQKCATEFGWLDVSSAIESRMEALQWSCVHCRGVCPPKAQCHTYKRINLQRRERARKKLEEDAREAAEAVVAVASEAGAGDNVLYDFIL